jgi:hypothetical protein
LFDRKRLIDAIRGAHRLLSGLWLVRVRRQRLFRCRLEQRFQRREALLDRSLALVKQYHSEVGEVFLQARDPGFQMREPLDQICLKDQRGRQRNSVRSGLGFLGSQALCWLLF